MNDRVFDDVIRRALSELHNQPGRAGAVSGYCAVARLRGSPAADDLAARLAGQFDLDVLEEARRRVRRRVEPATWAAYVGMAEQGLPGLEVARLTGLTVQKVYVAKHRVLRLLQEEVRRLRGGPQPPTPR
jgi:RNA polymerase sigma-70 factor (ECF subfamily)